MSLWRYESIQAYLHISPSSAKDFDKIKDFLNLMKFRWQFYHYPTKSICVDERMISFKGTSDLVKYEPSKPTKWGFRAYILASCDSNYTYDFDICPDLEV